MTDEPAGSSHIEDSTGWVLVSHRNSMKADAESAAPRTASAAPAVEQSTSLQPDTAAAAAAPASLAAPASSEQGQLAASSLPLEHPTDDQILQQENKIREELAARTPCVGDSEPLSALAKEYETGSQIYVHKARYLDTLYSAVRRTRGDGNCFFRSFIFAYIEHITRHQDLQERNRLVTAMRQWKSRLIQTGIMELVFEDAQDLLIDQLNSLGTSDPMTVSALESNMRDDSISPMVVMYLRLLTSVALHERREFFEPFVLGLMDMDVQQFRQRCVEPMGEESDHLHIVALTDALQVPIRVMYLDQSTAAAMAGVATGDAVVNHHDFVPEAAASAAGCKPVPRVHLLYRPGHYDILYPRIELDLS